MSFPLPFFSLKLLHKGAICFGSQFCRSQLTVVPVSRQYSQVCDRAKTAYFMNKLYMR